MVLEINLQHQIMMEMGMMDIVEKMKKYVENIK
jgi:hypothetical protein